MKRIEKFLRYEEIQRKYNSESNITMQHITKDRIVVKRLIMLKIIYLLASVILTNYFRSTTIKIQRPGPQYSRFCSERLMEKLIILTRDTCLFFAKFSDEYSFNHLISFYPPTHLVESSVYSFVECDE